MDWEKLNVKIEIPKNIQRILFLVISAILLDAILYDIIDYFTIEWYRVCKILFPILSAVPAFIVFKKKGNNFRELLKCDYWKSIGFGFGLGMVLLLVMMTIMNGWKTVTIEGNLMEKMWWYGIYIFVYYFIVVGFTEEFVFRVVMQDAFDEICNKLPVLSPIITAVVFSIIHFIGGGIQITIISLVWGLIWGLLRYKKVSYLTLAISHGLYDFGLVVLPLIISKI